MLTEQILLQFIVILITVQVFGYLCKFVHQQWLIAARGETCNLKGKEPGEAIQQDFYQRRSQYKL